MIQSCWVAVGPRSRAICGQREAQHGVVDRDEQHRQHEHDERGPGASPADAGGGARRRRGVVDGCVVRRGQRGRHFDATRSCIYRPAGTVSDADPIRRYDRAHEPSAARPRERARRVRGAPHRRAASAPRRWTPSPAPPASPRAGCSTTSPRRTRSSTASSNGSTTAVDDGHRRDPHRSDEGVVAYLIRTSVRRRHAPSTARSSPSSRLAQGHDGAPAGASRAIHAAGTTSSPTPWATRSSPGRSS